MTLDPATHRPEVIQAVYGDRPKCLVTLLWQFCDPHHILGRGQLFGVKPDDPDRILFSSVYGLAPLNRDVHQGPLRDHRHFRALLLEQAERKVQEAILRGRYVRSEIDELFIERFRDPWLTEHGFLSA